MVKWCLYLWHQSPRAYYAYHNISSAAGFCTEIDKILMEDSSVASLKEFQKHVCILGDEMNILFMTRSVENLSDL